MKRKFGLFIIFLVVFSLGAEELYQNRRNAIVRAVEEVSPAVVSLSLVKRRERKHYSIADYFDSLFFGRPLEYKVEEEIIHLPKVGSGFLINSKGYILTNSHVIRDAEKVEVTLPDGRVFDGELIGNDPLTDICLLKIEGDNLPYVKLGNSDELFTGEWSIALGNPYGPAIESPEPTVTVGVISGVNRNIKSQQTQRVYRDMIQTDASINPGNSGGPLVDSTGQVIGINTFIFTRSGGAEGIGFAIPINRAKRISSLLKEHGKIERPSLEFNIQEVTDEIADILEFEESGVLVTSINPGSREARSGLQRGDIITHINDNEILSVEHFRSFIRDIIKGSTVQYRVFRRGDLKDIQVQY